jgi:Flp pilus assembly protein TadB
VKTATDREGHVEDRYNYKLCRNERKSGVLMHVTSLPSPYGIGTMGDEALEFIDFLVLSGQSYWQILPLGATGFGDSPYQSFSSRAGNLYLIDPDELVRKGLLSEDSPKQFDFGDDPEGVDYGLLWKNRRDLLCLAWETFQEKSSDSLKQAFATFRKNESDWLQDYALFMTIKATMNGAPWRLWPDPLKWRNPVALVEFAESHRHDILFEQFIQFLPLSVLYLLSMFALFVLLLLLAPEKVKKKTRRSQRRKKRTKKLPNNRRTATLLSRLYLDWLPGQIGMTISSSVQLLAEDKEDAWLQYMTRKVNDLVFGFVIATLFLLSGRVSPFIVALAVVSVSIARDIESCSEAAKRRENYRFYYPSAVNSLYILLESGLTFDRALRMVAKVNLSNRHDNDPVANDLNKAVIHLETGCDSVMAANWLAEHCPLPEVQAALRLMARYEREGGREILELIRMQADRGRQLYRDAMRGRAEQRSLMFVFPMAIDLIVVMATVILPAMTQMGFLV